MAPHADDSPYPAEGRGDAPAGQRPEDDAVGLGRVVEDRRPVPRPAGDEASPPADVEEASEESFPASDPPARGGDALTPRD